MIAEANILKTIYPQYENRKQFYDTRILEVQDGFMHSLVNRIICTYFLLLGGLK